MNSLISSINERDFIYAIFQFSLESVSIAPSARDKTFRIRRSDLEIEISVEYGRFYDDVLTIRIGNISWPEDVDIATDDDAQVAKNIAFLRETSELADVLATEFLEWVRLEQPWIGLHGQKAERIGNPYIEVPGRSIEYSPDTIAKKTNRRVGPALSELTERHITDIASRLGGDKTIPLLVESLLADAQYFLVSTTPDYARAILTAAIACEVHVKQTLRQKARDSQRELLELVIENPRDTSVAAINLFDKVTGAVLGRSVRECKEAISGISVYDGLRQLFETRNKIAHKGFVPKKSQAETQVEAARQTIAWLNGL